MLVHASTEDGGSAEKGGKSSNMLSLQAVIYSSWGVGWVQAIIPALE